jgi:hypothetical protein
MKLRLAVRVLAARFSWSLAARGFGRLTDGFSSRLSSLVPRVWRRLSNRYQPAIHRQEL